MGLRMSAVSALRPRTSAVGRTATPALLALPGVLTLWLGFSSGGYFAGAPAAAAAVCAGLLAARALLAAEPFAGVGPWVWVGGGALAALAGWTLLSAVWSDALARALIEFDRVLLYGLVFVLMATIGRTRQRVFAAAGIVALAAVVICAAALASRTLPDVFPTEPNFANKRLSHPLSYWNALGLVAAIGLILCAHLGAGRGPAAVRILGTAALPMLAATLILTFSRGAIVVAAVFLAVYVVVGRPAGIVGVLLAGGPAAALAVGWALDADLLAQPDPTTAAAIDQGHGLALRVGAVTIGAAVVRGVTLGLDWRVRALVLATTTRRLRVLLGAVAATAAIVAAVAAGAPGAVADRFDEFFGESATGTAARPLRDRLTVADNHDRVRMWEVSLDRFARDRWLGSGAGTFAITWAADRPAPANGRPAIQAQDAHSLYVEVLGELGLPGLLALATALVAIAARLVLLARGPDRALYAAVLAATLAWAVHAGIDWDWEMPATTAWVFAVGGLVCARDRADATPGARLWPRAVVAVACILLSAAPLQMAVSQRRLNDGVNALLAGDCPRAIEAASAAAAALGSRPEPLEVQGLCLSRLGEDAAAVRGLEAAVERDPRSWELHYELALVRGAAGLDPRRAAGVARRLNPHSPLTQLAARVLTGTRPAVWRRQAERLPIVVPGQPAAGAPSPSPR